MRAESLRSIAIIAVLHGVSALPISADVVRARTVALTGQQAPGVEAGIVFAQLFLPVIDGQGLAVFAAQLAGPGVDNTNDIGIWSETTGTLSLVARKGSQAPGQGPGVTFRSVTSGGVAVNRDGTVSFSGLLNDASSPSGSRYYIWRSAFGAHEAVVISGYHFAGLEENETLLWVGPPARVLLNNEGRTIFEGFYLNSGESELRTAYWSEGSGNFVLAAETAALPNEPDEFGMLGTPIINDDGAMYFKCDSCVCIHHNGSSAQIACGGQPAPGTNGLVLAYILWNSGSTQPPLALSTNGNIAFRALLRDSEGQPVPNDLGIWSFLAGELDLVIRRGEQAPGAVPGTTISNLHSMLLMNEPGELLFTADLTGAATVPYDRAMYIRRSNGPIEKIVRRGDQIPGMGPDQSVATILADRVALNSAGQIVFEASVTGDGISSATDGALFAVLVDGSVRKIAREGDQIEVADGEFRTIHGNLAITFAGGSGGSDGRSSGLSDFGAVVFKAGFTDYSNGIFVAKIPDCALIGDMNDDNVRDGLDIPLFAACLLSSSEGCACADMNLDDAADVSDIAPFVVLLLAE